MGAKVFGWSKLIAILLAVAALTFLAIRVYDVQRGPALEVWHTYVPRELDAEAIDKTDWNGYLAKEARILDDLRREVSQKLTSGERVPINRYFEGSPVYPPHFSQDFNRSFVLEPDGAPRGVVVLLHGLTDSPYSQRHIARLYRDRGFVALVIRLPGHGTVPRGIDSGDVGRMVGGDTSGSTRSAAACACACAPSSRRFLQRRRPGAQIRARWH